VAESLEESKNGEDELLKDLYIEVMCKPLRLPNADDEIVMISNSYSEWNSQQARKNIVLNSKPEEE
jgi:hypothetical protein